MSISWNLINRGALLAMLVAIPYGTPVPVSASPAGARSPLSLAEHQPAGLTTTLSFDAEAYQQVASQDEVLIERFPLGRNLVADLNLRRVDVLAENAQVVVGSPFGDVALDRPQVAIFSGEVVGESDSHVFLGFSPYGSNGYVQTERATYVVSTPLDRPERTTIVYNLTDLPEDAIKIGGFTCKVREPGLQLNGQHDTDNPFPNGGNALSCRLVDVAVETDWEMTDIFDGDADAAAAYTTLLLGASSDIYTRDVSVRLQITFLRVWEADNDPYGGNDGLTEFVDYWNANMNGVERDVATMVSGRNLGYGVAYLPGVCQGEFAYSFSSSISGFFPYPPEHNNDQNWDIIVVSHELGHNFGSPHTHDYEPPIDECAFGGCENAENGTLMSYCHACPGGLANFRLEFHPRVIERMSEYLTDEAPCDTLANPADLDCDGAVGSSDLILLLGDWGACADCTDCPADLDGDCVVGTGDLVILLGSWG